MLKQTTNIYEAYGNAGRQLNDVGQDIFDSVIYKLRLHGKRRFSQHIIFAAIEVVMKEKNINLSDKAQVYLAQLVITDQRVSQDMKYKEPVFYMNPEPLASKPLDKDVYDF